MRGQTAGATATYRGPAQKGLSPPNEYENLIRDVNAYMIERSSSSQSKAPSAIPRLLDGSSGLSKRKLPMYAYTALGGQRQFSRRFVEVSSFPKTHISV